MALELGTKRLKNIEKAKEGLKSLYELGRNLLKRDDKIKSVVSATGNNAPANLIFNLGDDLSRTGKPPHVGGAKPETPGGAKPRDKVELGGSDGPEAGPSSGAENIATIPKLQDQLRKQNLDNIARADDRLAVAVRGDGTKKINFGIGRADSNKANELGKKWVGDGAVPVKNQKACPGCLIVMEK